MRKWRDNESDQSQDGKLSGQSVVTFSATVVTGKIHLTNEKTAGYLHGQSRDGKLSGQSG